MDVDDADNVYRVLAENPLPGNIASTQDTGRISQFYVDHVKGQVLFSNSSQMPVEMDIMHIIAKKTQDKSVDQAWGDGLGSIFGNLDGFNTQSFTYTPGQHPRLSPDFNENFRIVDTKRVNMSGGSVHKHSYGYNYNKVFPRQETRDLKLFIQGWTHIIHVVVRGYPVWNDSKDAVMTAPINIDCVHWENYSFRPLQNNRPTAQSFTNMVLADFNQPNRYDFVTNSGEAEAENVEIGNTEDPTIP